ncbi:LysM peptidoglycan-binding domain-containing protein [Leucobacter komagatae]|uniref:LysM peptidoglycan-binding domain-containing protein n=1 Tax=Leucobacter komagatae TaxID=55969 RepID=UPI0009FBB683|nr:LysM peptidoglycan-binding domain-containing protein [Leucobacter komagatae]
MTATAIVTPVIRRTDAARANASVGDAAVATAPQTRFRLTRRGRVVFGGLATVLVAGALAIGAAFAAPGAVANGAESTQEFPYVLVQAGDSLWSIASALEPGADPRDVVAEIVRLNQIDGASLQAGDAIAVPLRFEGSEHTLAASAL